MKRAALLLALLAFFGFSGCKSNSTTPPAPMVSVSPATATVETGAQFQFGATVTNATAASGTAITWLVNGASTLAAQQTAGFGTIDATGLYTAPNTVPTAPQVTIAAELTQEPAIVNVATVDIAAVPVVNVSPTTATVAAGQQTTLTVCLFDVPKDLNGNQETGVTYYVNGIAGGNSTVGTVAAVAVTGMPTCTPSIPGEPAPQQAVYTAPQIPPSNGKAVITAVLNADATQTAVATITDTYSLFSLQHSFVFNVSGTYSFTQPAGCVKSGYFARAGRITADGLGGLTVGEDVEVAGSPPQNIQVKGTYAIGVDGRGTATIPDPSAFGCGTTASNYSIVLVSQSQVQIAEADTFATGHGEADAQDPNEAFTGNLPANSFAFDFSGSSLAGVVTKPTSEIGQFTLSGASIAKGQADSNAGGTLTSVPSGSLAGSFGSTDANGRGTATIQGTSYVYYMITAARVRFLEMDALGTLTGDAFQQPNNPTFSTSSLSSFCSFLASGRSPSGLATTGGVFFAATDGSGGISAGVLDQNNAGVVQANAATLAGSAFGVDGNGRGTLTLTTNSGALNFVFYFISAGQAVLQETDSSIVADGLLVTQQGLPPNFATQSLVGPFAQQWTGAAAATFAEADTTGQIALTATTASVAGTWDTNNALTLVAGNALTGTYSMSGNGRGTLVITDAAHNTYNMSIYISSLTPTGSVVFVVGTDVTRVLAGQLAQQF